MAPLDTRRARRGVVTLFPGNSGSGAGVRRRDHGRGRHACVAVDHGPGLRVDHGARSVRQRRQELRLAGTASRFPGPARPHQQTAGRCLRRHRPVERAAFHCRHEAGAGHRHRFHHGAQDRSRDTVARSPHRRVRKGSRHPRRRDQRRIGRPSRLGIPRPTPRHRQGVLHRLRPHRLDRRLDLR